MMNRRNMLAALAATLTLPACTGGSMSALLTGSSGRVPEPDLEKHSREAAMALWMGAGPKREYAMLMTTIASVDNLEHASTFGRVLGEQVAAQLTRTGFVVLEARNTGVLAVDAKGEFMLSRHLREQARERRAATVLVGTYGLVGTTVYVSLKLVDMSDDRVLSAHAFSFPVPTRQVGERPIRY